MSELENQKVRKQAEMEDLQAQLAAQQISSAALREVHSEAKAAAAALWQKDGYFEAGQKVAEIKARLAPCNRRESQLQVQIRIARAELKAIQRRIDSQKLGADDYEADELWFMDTLCNIIRRGCESGSIALTEGESIAFKAAKKRFRKMVPPVVRQRKNADTKQVIASFRGKV